MERGFRESFCFFYVYTSSLYLVEQNKPFVLEQTKQHSSSSAAVRTLPSTTWHSLPPPEKRLLSCVWVNASPRAEAIGGAVVGVTQACGQGDGVGARSNAIVPCPVIILICVLSCKKLKIEKLKS